jgi:hypothetical protein
LLTIGSPSEQQGAELKRLLGNTNSRIRSGPSIPPQTCGSVIGDRVVLEQSRARSRVDVDVILDSDSYVQGAYMKGFVKVLVRRQARKDSRLLLASPKLRVVGYECGPHPVQPHMFYYCDNFLKDITEVTQAAYLVQPEASVFVPAKAGIHTIPFALLLPMGNNNGILKAPISMQNGICIKYIVIALVFRCLSRVFTDVP